MFKRYLLLSVLLFFSKQIKAQDFNLLPDSSLEKVDTCEYNSQVDYYCTYWHAPIHWPKYYFNACQMPGGSVDMIPTADNFGKQFPKTDSAMGAIWAIDYDASPNGIKTNISGYIQSSLKAPLVAGHKYYCGFYANLNDAYALACNNVAAMLSIDSLPQHYNDSIFALTPQVTYKGTGYLTDTVGWMLVADTITAQGGERFFTIGRFKDGRPLDTLRIQPNGQIPGGPFIYNGSFYFIDDAFVIPMDSLTGSEQLLVSSNKGIRVQPNPVKDYFMLSNSANVKLVCLHNNLGKEVMYCKTKERYDVSNLSEGLYFVSVYLNDGTIVNAKLVIQR